MMFEFHFDSCSFVKYAAFGRFDTILHVRDLILKIFLIVGVCILHLEWFSKLFFNQKHDTHVFIQPTLCELAMATSMLVMYASRMMLTQFGYTDVGDGCWRRNVFVTPIRC